MHLRLNKKYFYLVLISIIAALVFSTAFSKSIKRPAEQGSYEITLNGRTPKVPKGGVYQDENGVFHYPEQVIGFLNGTFVEHSISNGHMAIYKNPNKKYTLKKGQSIVLDFDIDEVEYCDDGFRAVVGYIKNAVYTEYCSTILLGNSTKIEFIAPEDGEYDFYALNISAATIYANSLSIN